tara:strand:+ start:8143 stop:10344 length:2202 start_codon:yes stop_codon:yes gene_type:complete
VIRHLWTRARRSESAYDFPGGVHPPARKARSNAAPIRVGPLPARLVLPLNMHLGAPARPRVTVGERVLKGQRIADAQGTVSTSVHASTSGTVVAIGPHPVPGTAAGDALCIVIDSDGEDRWGPLEPWPDYRRAAPTELVQRLRQAGIAGLGGAGFPSAAKTRLGEGQRVHTLIINAAECEPYITADDRLMRERAGQIAIGIDILQHLLNPSRTLIGIEDDKPEAIDALRAAMSERDCELRVVPTRYPSGGEKQLIQLLTGLEIASGTLPSQAGVVCQNVATAYAIKRAVIDGEPLISRITTVTGDAVARPGNYEVLLGTSVEQLLQHAGLDRHRLVRLLMGGPMMGFTLSDTSVPVVKISNCLIAADARELPEPPPEQACIRCGDCATVCPASLLPQQLYWHARSDQFERARQNDLIDCIECGACAYVCPSHIPLVHYYRYAKQALRAHDDEQIKADRARLRFEARQARLEREQAEKEQRRRARLEANRDRAAATSAAPDHHGGNQKKQLGRAITAYKAAQRAATTAEAQGAANAVELRQRALDLKQQADRLQGRSPQADTAPSGVVAAAPKATPTATASDQRERRLKALKSAYGRAHKQYKQAHAALQRAQRAQAEHPQSNDHNDVAGMEQRVAQLKARADQERAALDTLMEQAKSDLQQRAGKDLKTLKVEAARAEVALRRHAERLRAGRDSADTDTLRRWDAELKQLEREAHRSREALTQAVRAQGLVED